MKIFWLTAVGVAAGMGGGLLGQPITPSVYWRNTIEYATDPFVVAPVDPNDPRWVKFSIFVSDPGTVYFQDSVHYPFHLSFAAERLDPYIGIEAASFNSITLFNSGQELQLGAVLFPPGSPSGVGPREFAVQFIKNDAMTPQAVVSYFNTVKSNVHADPAATALYFPTFEQAATAQANAAFLASNGVTVSSPTRWATGNRTYSTGFALGTLKFVTASNVQNAYLAGTLRPEDILLTDGVPAELPLVAGVISLAPVTPNSHVVLLSQTYNVPLVFLSQPADVQQAQGLVGRTTLLSSYVVSDVSTVTLVDATAIPAAFQAQLQALHGAGTIQFTPLQPRGVYSLNTQTLTPADVKYVGGKAANYGYLRRAVPANARPAAAITLDLWTEFMDQPLTNGRTLRQEIHTRLDPYQWPPDFAQLSASLAGVRNLITSTTSTQFTPAQISGVFATLQDPQYGFDPNIKLRFRSSTNVEDLASFTGAGLYDSFSGCFHDDTDADAAGPSWCDASEGSERGVFRAIRKVYASFYNDNAFIQRLRAGVNEDQVGMGLLVHHSFPDATELANGVALFDRTVVEPAAMNIVTQVGAISVTNPTDDSIPEEVRIDFWAPNFWLPRPIRQSNRVVLGDAVMPFPDAYITLGSLLTAVADQITQETGVVAPLLDFEFKRVTPDGSIDLKQVRRVPAPSTTPSITPALVAVPTQYCMYQGEYGDVFANHRLKTQLDLTTKNMFLSPGNLQSSIYATMEMNYNDGCGVRTLSGAPGAFPASSFGFSGSTTVDGWVMDSMRHPASFMLSTAGVRTLVAPSESPILTPMDLGTPPRGSLLLTAARQAPVTTVDYFNVLHPDTLTETALLCPCSQLPVGPLQHREFALPGGVVVDTQFYWTRPPTFPEIFYTADLAAWDRTIIAGLTTQPITLRGYFSQTYRPGHHNQLEWFIFEPRLDPDITGPQLAELSSAGIARLMVYSNPAGNRLEVLYMNDPVGCAAPCSADIDSDGDTGTDADIEAFFACLAGNCCAACWGPDFNADGDPGTDADIESFFRVLSGGGC